MVNLCGQCALKNVFLSTFLKYNLLYIPLRNISNLQFKYHKISNYKTRKSIPVFIFNHCKLFHTTSCSKTFWEKDSKGGYISTQIPSSTQLIREGLKELKNEIHLWKEEVKEKLECDPILVYRPGEVDIHWQFGSDTNMSKWITSCDSDHKEGFSSCELVTSPAGKGLFHGNLCTTVPKDGRVKRAGYCNMRSVRARKSFKRETFYDWRMYTHLVIRVRGDGRPYLLNISTMGYFDLFWNDIYHYALYTRGGPYWQVSKIPFSKFFLSSKGRIQDKQAPIRLDKVTHFGISLGDKVDGQFHLEIDYIGLEFDPTHTEEFAYEMYQMPKYIAAT